MSTIRKFFAYYPLTLVAFAAFFSVVGLLVKNDPLIGLTPGQWWLYVLTTPAFVLVLYHLGHEKDNDKADDARWKRLTILFAINGAFFFGLGLVFWRIDPNEGFPLVFIGAAGYMIAPALVWIIPLAYSRLYWRPPVPRKQR